MKDSEKKIKEIEPLITKSKEEKAVKKYKNDENYEFNDFSSKFHSIFVHQLLIYWKMNGYYTNDGVLNLNLVRKDFYYLDQAIKQNTNDKEFISFNEKSKTD